MATDGCSGAVPKKPQQISAAFAYSPCHCVISIFCRSENSQIITVADTVGVHTISFNCQNSENIARRFAVRQLCGQVFSAQILISKDRDLFLPVMIECMEMVPARVQGLIWLAAEI